MRFEAKVTGGERHPRTLEAHRYHLEHNLLPRLASRRIAALGVEDVAALITELRSNGRSAKSAANACWSPRSAHAAHAVANGCWAGQRSSACSRPGRLLVVTALYSGPRISELLGLIWEDVDFAAGLIRVRAQLSAPTAASRRNGWRRRRLPRCARCRWSSSSHTSSPRTSSLAARRHRRRDLWCIASSPRTEER